MPNFSILTNIQPTLDANNDLVTTHPVYSGTLQSAATGINAVQTVSVYGSPTGGTFTLSYGGQTTQPITYPATSSTVQTALQALSSIGTGNATVATSTNFPYVVTFVNSLGLQVVPLITGDASSLTGGSGPSILSVMTTAGLSPLGNGTPLNVSNSSSCVFTVSGTFVGTVIFQGTEDGTNWATLSVNQFGNNAIVNSVTGTGLFEASVAGLQSVRAKVTAWTSGTITVTAHAADSDYSPTGETVTISNFPATQNVLETVVPPVLTPFTIAISTSISPAIDLGGARMIRLHMPAAWDAASLTFQTSFDNTVFNDLFNADGTEYVVSAAAGRTFLLDATKLIGLRYVKVRSGTSATPVNQTAARTINVITRII